MSVYFIQGETLTQIAASIRSKTKDTDKITPEEMPALIDSISGEPGTPAEVRLQEKTVTVNGIVTPDRGYDGLSKVTVNVEGGNGVFIVTGEAAVASVENNVLVVSNAGGFSAGSQASVTTGPVGYMTVNSADVSGTENSLTIGE